MLGSPQRRLDEVVRPRDGGSRTERSAATRRHAQATGQAVEIEIGVLRAQCLDRRIGERETLVEAWQRQRNASGARIKWMFNTETARSKLARAYPNVGKES